MLDLSRRPLPEVPLALWHEHRRRPVGDEVDLVLPAAPEAAALLVEGGGFAAVGPPRAELGATVVPARRERTLADTVGPGVRLLCVGLNPSLVAADAGVPFHRAGNRFWPAALAAGVASVDRDPLHALEHHGLGLTDLVKRASPRAGELTAGEYAHGLGRLRWLCRVLRPAAVCVVGLTGWRAAVDPGAGAGRQPPLEGCPVHLMPNPSGANAHASLAQLTEHLRAAAALADAGAATYPGPRSGPAPRPRR